MDTQSLRLRRYAYVFVSINLLLLFTLIGFHALSLRSVNMSRDQHGRLVRDWFALKSDLVLDPAAPDTEAQVQRFSSDLSEFISTNTIALSSELSEPIVAALLSLSRAWESFEADLIDGQTPVQTRFDRFEAVLSDLEQASERSVELHRRVITTLSFFFAVALVAVVGIVAFLGREAAREHRDAMQARTFAQATIRGQELERARISRALHDSLAQELAVALMDVDGGAETGSAETARRLRRRLRSAIDWVRHLSHEMHPGDLSEMGLTRSLSSYCDELDTVESAALHREIPPGIPEFRGEAAINVYRIAQEAVTNAIRHACARNVTLRVEYGGDELTITVVDDGAGIEHGLHHATDRSGIGITGMYERARMLNAELSISPVASGGTEVRLIVPADSLE